MKLFSEIKRRKVIQGVIAYAVAGWLIIQLAIALESSLELPSYVDRYVTMAVIAGLPVAILLSWIFDISLGGIKATEADKTAKPATYTLMPVIEKKPATKNSIAVLPFVDMSPEKDQEYLGDGVAEEILNALVQVTPLNVSGRTSSFSFKDKDVDIKHIGEALSVMHVLEGSIRKQGDRVRITAQLIKADDGFHVWSETYDGDLKDIFDLQDNIAKAIVEALEVVLDDNQVRLVSKVTSSPEAYELYLRGRKLAQKQDGKGVLKQAIEYLEDAVARDPEFARAWSVLALANFWVLEHTVAKGWKANVEAGKRAAQRAYELDKSSFHSYGAMFLADAMDGRFGDGVDRVHAGYKLEPNNPTAKFGWATTLGAIGLSEASIALMSEVIVKDAQSASFIAVSAHPHWAMGDIVRTKETLLQAFELGYHGAGTLYPILLSDDDPKSAIKFFNENYERFGPIVTKSPLKYRILRYLFEQAVYGRKKWARALAKPIVSGFVMSDETAPSNVTGYIPANFGYTELFFEALSKKPNPYLQAPLMHIWVQNPDSKAIRTHKDFPQFAQDIGLVQAWQTYGWPKWVTPNPGTDGSDLQFTVT